MADVTITNDAWMAKQRETDALLSENQALRTALRAVVQTALDMRSWQRRYFKERTPSALAEAKRLEKELDKLLSD